ncbi:hypothetical protein [Limnoraphis robusta]|nr:hypothetical protein [Limnoraphis robusta]MEA5496167.1 hypothetical protein [Limnoraphis robusta BA-68 BA1]
MFSTGSAEEIGLPPKTPTDGGSIRLDRCDPLIVGLAESGGFHPDTHL